LGVAFEQVCIGLRTGDCHDDVKQAIANKIIALSKTSERNPDLLCERALKGICEPQVYAALARCRERALRANARPRSDRRKAPRPHTCSQPCATPPLRV